jgi:hypothetical protein
MSQTAQAVETAVAAQSLLGSHRAKFTFPSDKTSTRTAQSSFNPPSGTQSALIALQEFNVAYSDSDYELKDLQISLSTTNTQATCTATLRDKNLNGQLWEGTVVGLVMFFGRA